MRNYTREIGETVKKYVEETVGQTAHDSWGRITKITLRQDLAEEIQKRVRVSFEQLVSDYCTGVYEEMKKRFDGKIYTAMHNALKDAVIEVKTALISKVMAAVQILVVDETQQDQDKKD